MRANEECPTINNGDRSSTRKVIGPHSNKLIYNNIFDISTFECEDEA
jgi:hypothetical protein